MNAHTQEPWRVLEDWYSGELHYMVVDANGIILLDTLNRSPVANSASELHDVRRIVACVNACAGVATETLENSPDLASAFLSAENAKLIQQRDELRDVLRETLAGFKMVRQGILGEDSLDGIFQNAKYAIVKAEANHG